MNDPVGAFERIRDNFLLYVKTAFQTQFTSVEEEREALLKRTAPDNRRILPRPSMEPSHVTRTDKRITELEPQNVPNLTGRNLSDFKSFAAQGLVGNYPLFSHQIEMCTSP